MDVSVWEISLVAAILGWDLAYLFALLRYGRLPGRGEIVRLYHELRGDPPPRKRGWFERFRTDVDRSNLAHKHLTLYTVLSWLLLFGLCFVVMQKLFVAAGVASFVFLYPRYYLNQVIRKRRELLNDQLRQVLLCLVNSLRSGASLEVALERCPDDLRKLLGSQQQKPMLYEIEQLVHELKMGTSVEEALIHVRDRVKLEDMDDLVNALLTVRTTGGNLVELMERVAQTIGERIEVRGQVRVLTASKRFESTMLTTAPVGMIVFLNLIPGYMQPLYEHPVGQILAVCGAGCLVGAFFWGRRLAEIDL